MCSGSPTPDEAEIKRMRAERKAKLKADGKRLMMCRGCHQQKTVGVMAESARCGLCGGEYGEYDAATDTIDGEPA